MVIYDLMPLDILIEKRASETMARINNQIQPSWDGIGKGNKNGLIKRWRSAAAEICNEIVITDRIPTKIVKERNFIVHVPRDGRLKDKVYSVTLMAQFLIVEQDVVYTQYKEKESFTMAISIWGILLQCFKLK